MGDAAGVVINSHQGIAFALTNCRGSKNEKNCSKSLRFVRLPGQELVTVPAAVMEGNNTVNNKLFIDIFDIFYRNGK